MITQASSPCVICGTREGTKRSSGDYVRYRAEPYGLEGVLCATCRARFRRAATAESEGRVAGRIGRPRKNPAPGTPYIPVRRTKPLVVHSLTPEEVAERILSVREEADRRGRRPAVAESAVEIERRQWAELAMQDRRDVAEQRQRAMRLGMVLR